MNNFYVPENIYVFSQYWFTLKVFVDLTNICAPKIEYLSGMYLGTVIAMPLAGILAEHINWESIFYVFGASIFPKTFLTVVFFKGSPKPVHKFWSNHFLGPWWSWSWSWSGFLALLWCGLWWWIVEDSPDQDRSITDAELEYLQVATCSSPENLKCIIIISSISFIIMIRTRWVWRPEKQLANLRGVLWWPASRCHHYHCDDQNYSWDIKSK